MNTNQYKLSISINGYIDWPTMISINNLFGVKTINIMADYIIVEMINEFGSNDIDALTRMLQMRGFSVVVTEHCV